MPSKGRSAKPADRAGEKERDRGQERAGRPVDGRLAVLGSPGVGKSALVVRFLTRRFIWEYDPTLECTYQHVAAVDEETSLLEILDTAGQCEDGSREGQIRWAEGFLLVYSITDRTSFMGVSRLKQHLADVRGPSTFPAVLVGNKSDLKQARQVHFSEGESLAMELGVAFFETSACEEATTVEEVFAELVREVRRRRQLDSRPRRRSSASQVRQVLNKVFTKIQNG